MTDDAGLGFRVLPGETISVDGPSWCPYLLTLKRINGKGSH